MLTHVTIEVYHLNIPGFDCQKSFMLYLKGIYMICNDTNNYNTTIII